MPYLLISDPHYEDFSQFANKNHSGINSRLENTILATYEATNHLTAMGGNVMVVAGDVFHKRGQLQPSVLNPVLDLYRSIVDAGIKVYMIPGNHDLESNKSSRLSSAITALESVGVNVISEAHIVSIGTDTSLALIPWIADTNELVEIAKDLRKKVKTSMSDLIIHAPLAKVLPSLMDHGLSPEALSKLGYRYVWAGHYHNACSPCDGVYSIGALTHQTWGDVGSLAGYRMVSIDSLGVTHRETLAPKFVDFNGDLSKVPGNFIRVTEELTPTEANDLRADLISKGAKGVLVRAIKKTVVKRSSSSTAGVLSVESMIHEYAKKHGLTSSEVSKAIEYLKIAEEV